MLIFPAKPADPGLSGRFKESNLNRFTLDFAIAQPGLLVGDGNQRIVIDCLQSLPLVYCSPLGEYGWSRLLAHVLEPVGK